MDTLNISSTKVCCACGEALEGKQRFKDSQGRYWCALCGAADREKQRQAVRTPCYVCGKMFASGSLFQVTSRSFCIECVPHRSTPATPSAADGSWSARFITRLPLGPLAKPAPFFLAMAILVLGIVIVLETTNFQIQRSDTPDTLRDPEAPLLEASTPAAQPPADR